MLPKIVVATHTATNRPQNKGGHNWCKERD